MVSHKNKKDQTTPHFSHGFTIVELLVVIVVIGVLAAIALLSFYGIADRARDSALKADLNSASKLLAVELGTSTTGQYPSNLLGLNLPDTSGTTYSYTVDNLATPPTYCLTGFLDTLSFYITQDSNVPQSGTCPGHSPIVLLPNDGVVTTIAVQDDPRGIVVNQAGEIFVTAQSARTINKVLENGTVTVFAGSGTNATVNGNGTSASFNTPGGLAIDSQGNMYTAECNGQRIRKIDPDANVTTFAGSGTFGYQDGPAASARFWCPQGVAVGPNDDVYVTESNNHRVRKITQAGVVSTLAGSGVAGSANGVGTAASFNGPHGIATDSAGNVYVTDDNRFSVRKITPDGTVTTYAGGSVTGYLDAPVALDALFNTNRGSPFVDSSGTMYLADGANHRIRKITPEGVVTTFAGSGVNATLDGIGTAARFNYPRNIFVTPDGTIYVADNTGDRIRKIR